MRLPLLRHSGELVYGVRTVHDIHVQLSIGNQRLRLPTQRKLSITWFPGDVCSVLCRHVTYSRSECTAQCVNSTMKT